MTGIATPANTIHNAEMILFRDNDALVVMNYSFRGTDPMGDAEAALATLCPPKTV